MKCQEDWTLKTSSEKLTLTCVNMHTPFTKWFTSSITMKYWSKTFIVFQYISPKDINESTHYGLLNFKCLMTNHATFDTQLEHVSATPAHV